MENLTKIKLKQSSVFSVKAMASIAVLAALSGVLMALEIPLPFLPPFYKLDFSEVPVLMGGFALGPGAAVIIETLKILIKLVLRGSSTMIVGDIANFAIGCALVVPAALLYRRGKTRKHALAGMGVGVACMTVVGAFLNAFVMLPFYAAVYGMPMSALVNMGSVVNPAITDVTTLVIFATTPLNLIKGVAVSVITFSLYKKVSPILHRR